VLASSRSEEENMYGVGAAKFAHGDGHSTREPC
jgi:hypothetical protein